MSDRMDEEDYRRDRSRSPKRERRRSRSPPPRRDYDRGGDRNGRSYYSSYRGSRGYGGDRPSYSRYGGYRDRDRPYGRDDREKNMREYEIKNNRIHANSIFIGNLPYSVQWWELKDHFQDAGDVVRADTVTSRGRPKGMGTVEFRTRDMALEAIKRYDRTTFMGREIFVREDLPPPEKSDDREM
ncbi:unnamed protein product [Ambrosiozyma monospora]|uniref:Unnamed protein product n=1 Tax=Ambrosiozyma monospora TaxID=43982 RepID=A0ACB5T756_AMBMO|nr:unnamed protein product [Ambrosiozyma monospora]